MHDVRATRVGIGYCLDIAQGKDAAALRKNTKARFTGQDGTAPTTAEADAIVALAKASVCP